MFAPQLTVEAGWSSLNDGWMYTAAKPSCCVCFREILKKNLLVWMFASELQVEWGESNMQTHQCSDVEWNKGKAAHG